MNSPVRLGVSPTAASTPTGVFNQWFEALFSHAGTLGCVVCSWVYQLLPHQPAAALPTPLHNLSPPWVHQPPPCLESSLPSCPSLLLLRVWMNVSSLSTWSLDFHTVLFCQFWLFFVFKLSFFWLCKEAHCVYLRLHLGQKSCELFSFARFFFRFKLFKIVVQVQLSPFSPNHSATPQPHPPPTLNPTWGFVHGSFIHVHWWLFPCYPLPPPLWLLSVGSLFQCLWLYLVCFFLLLIKFQLKVRSYCICQSPPGLFHVV